MGKKNEKLKKPNSPDSDQFHSVSANSKVEKETQVDKSYRKNTNHK